MASAFETRFSAAADALLVEHGESVTRWPSGREGAAVPVTALWSPDLTPDREATTEAERTVLGGTLQVRESAVADVSPDDKWVVDGELFATVGKPAKQAGMWAVRVQRVAGVSKSNNRNLV